MTGCCQIRNSDYKVIERSILWLEGHAAEQPRLNDLAKAVGLSPCHLQRLFTRWAGVSPKQFLQVLTTQQAKDVLRRGRSVLDAALDVGLSGPGRLHDHLVTLEAASPGEYKSGGVGVTIRYGVVESPFGACLIGVTDRGICHLSLHDSDRIPTPQDQLGREWPKATLRSSPAEVQKLAERIFPGNREPDPPLHLWVKGTNFQIKVWQALLSLPTGAVVTYQDVAENIRRPTAARAVGAAVGRNAIAYLVPCHRVIRKTGAIHGYRWGATRKKAMLAWEAARPGRQL